MGRQSAMSIKEEKRKTAPQINGYRKRQNGWWTIKKRTNNMPQTDNRTPDNGNSNTYRTSKTKKASEKRNYDNGELIRGNSMWTKTTRTLEMRGETSPVSSANVNLFNPMSHAPTETTLQHETNTCETERTSPQWEQQDLVCLFVCWLGFKGASTSMVILRS